MSQQKMLLAVALVAGCVAVASAQSWSMQSCSNGFQTHMDTYRKTCMSITQRFTNQLQQAGMQATDLAPFQQDVQKLTDSWSSMASSMTQGFDVARFTQVYMENISIVSSMMRNGFRAGLSANMLGSFTEMGNQIMGANTKFLEGVTNACMPQRLYRVQPTV